jgi:predicted ATPase/DNA-binding SARP family transcriptional activator
MDLILWRGTPYHEGEQRSRCAMQVDVLGPVRVRPAHGAPRPLMAKERALLSALALNVGRPVPFADLESALWGDRPPRTASKSLQNHVARLRRCVGAESIVTSAVGYALALRAADVDAHRLEMAAAAVPDSEVGGGWEQLRRQLAEAERLWRGEPLTDLADTPERQEQVDRLRELWRRVRDGRIRAEIGLGRNEQALNDLQRLVLEEPWRELLWGLLMLALYRSGRQVDALRAYRRARDQLAEEWGVDPSPELQRLHWRILRQDPQLELRSPSPHLHVPAPVNAFVGRAGQVGQLMDALASERLVTLHGPAGVGKSRLAVEVAREVGQRFPDGVWWIDLSVANDGDGAVRELAQTLGVAVAPDRSTEQGLVSHLEHRELLLVLDNCEHVVAALGPVVLRLLRQGAGVRVLATSRECLAVAGESRWEVPPLTTPAPDADPQDVIRADAVALFQQRRGRALSDVAPSSLAEVGRLCRSLEGLPLAVELAAAQTRRMTVHELNERLGAEILDAALPRSGEPRHESLRRAIGSSYAALEPQCRHLFDWLSPFPGDFDASAAEAMLRRSQGGSASDTQRCLARLVDASLVASRPAGDVTRFRLLFVMREFAAQQLQRRGETSAAWNAFTDHYRDVAIQAAAQLNGSRSGAWLAKVTLELANLRSAVDWSVGHEPPGQTLSFVPAMGRVIWGIPSDVGADLVRLTDVVVRADEGGADADRLAWAWQELVTAAYLTGDVAFALRACDRAEALFEQVADRAGLAVVCWHRGAAHLLATGNLAEAERIFRRGQARPTRRGWSPRRRGAAPIWPSCTAWPTR